MIECKVCGKEIVDKSWECYPVCSRECFNTDFWNGKLKIKDEETTVRIKGVHYFIGNENQRFDKGFGGQKFRIKFFDGRVVETTNLNYNGKIQEDFRERLPDNAEFMEV